MKVKIRQFSKRFLCVAMCVCIVLPLFPIDALAYMVDGVDTANIDEFTGANGAKVSYDPESWEEQFPYGTFAFSSMQSDVYEGGEDIILPVYRLGGTKGSATVWIEYQSSQMELADGEVSYAYAAS